MLFKVHKIVWVCGGLKFKQCDRTWSTKPILLASKWSVVTKHALVLKQFPKQEKRGVYLTITTTMHEHDHVSLLLQNLRLLQIDCHLFQGEKESQLSFT